MRIVVGKRHPARVQHQRVPGGQLRSHLRRSELREQVVQLVSILRQGQPEVGARPLKAEDVHRFQPAYELGQATDGGAFARSA